MLSFVHVKPPIDNFDLPTCLLDINNLKIDENRKVRL